MPVTTLFKKLNYKEQDPIVIINAPDSFAKEMKEMSKVTEILATPKIKKPIEFLIAFVTRQKEVDDIANTITPVMAEDGLLWLCYPKGTSKRYKCEFNRDTGWAEVGHAGFEPVRMVAIDEDWSALRFRRVEKIKVMTRSFAMTKEGKKRVTAARKLKSK